MNKTTRNLIMCIIGASLYLLVEIIYRGYTFRLSALMGAIAFLIGGSLSNKFSWKMDLLLQCFVISLVVTCLEAIVGSIDYYWLHQNMWDYSNLPFNYLNGKISLPFSFIWFILGFAIVFIYDAITYYWLHEGEQPEYWIFGRRIWQMPKRKCNIEH